MKWRAVGFLAVVLVFAAGFAGYRALHHRTVVGPSNAPTPVLVATQRIAKGTPGRRIATGLMYAPTTLPKNELEDGAISDPHWLSGRAAAVDILPGQQLTATNVTSRGR